jgi:Co/Zn/Cd efflux system component
MRRVWLPLSDAVARLDPPAHVVDMAHYRKPLAAAAALNTVIFVGEAVAGFLSESLSLIMDSVHNLSDEVALLTSHGPANVTFRRTSP